MLWKSSDRYISLSIKMKVVINACFGGFSLSPAAQYEYLRRKYGKEPAPRDSAADENPSDFGHEDVNLVDSDISFRADPILVSVVQELDSEANGKYAELKIVDVPDDVRVYVDDYDGIECVRENHRVWD